MQWRSNDVRMYLKGLTGKGEMVTKKNYETALDNVKMLTPATSQKKCVCMINGVRHDLKHLTVGVSPDTVTVFFDFTTTVPIEPVVWGLGSHAGGKNTEYLVKWDAGKASKVTLA